MRTPLPAELESLVEALPEWLSQHPAQSRRLRWTFCASTRPLFARLGLFGSFKREDQDEDSDVDFIVEFEGNENNLPDNGRLET